MTVSVIEKKYTKMGGKLLSRGLRKYLTKMTFEKTLEDYKGKSNAYMGWEESFQKMKTVSESLMLI